MPQEQPDPNRYNLRSGLTLYPVQQEAIETVLNNLTVQAPTQFILLADVTGQVVSTRGEQTQINLVPLGSLVAGDLAASHEIARLTGQYQDYQMVLREGQSSHTLICEAGHHLALLAQVSTETPLGWARMVIRKAAQRLADIAANPPPDIKQAPTSLPEPVQPAEDLSDLFSDALDELWLE